MFFGRNKMYHDKKKLLVSWLTINCNEYIITEFLYHSFFCESFCFLQMKRFDIILRIMLAPLDIFRGNRDSFQF